MPTTATAISIKDTAWTFPYTSGWQQQSLSGENWTTLDLLLPQPIVDVSAVPSVSPTTPGVAITGQSSLLVPVFIRLFFHPRTNSITLSSLAQNQAAQLTPYGIADVDISVLCDGALYGVDQDYTITDAGVFTSLTLPQNLPITVYFSENYPAFQCSIDSQTWSPIVMLDSARPYPDETTTFVPLSIQGNTFAITDEQGVVTGMFLSMTTPLAQATTFQVNARGTADAGLTAELEVEMEHPQFMNALALTPVNEYPATLTMVEVEGFAASSRKTVWSGSIALDRGMTIRFPSTVVRRVWLTMAQANYTLKQYAVEPPDQTRRNTMYALQTALPLAAQRTPASVPQVYSGAQYSFGVESLVGYNTTPVSGVFVAGPLTALGCPDVLRIDVDAYLAVNTYLCYKAFDATGSVVDENLQGIPIVNSATVMPFASTLNRAQVSSCDLYLKFVPRDPLAVIERYFIQVLNV
jgi:hypothetical protein